MITPQVANGYRYYLPSFVTADQGRKPRRRVICRECLGYWDNAQDRCPRYRAAVDSNGYRYCSNCGHTETVHPR